MQHKILIAEDDTDINRLLSRILEAQGYQALQAFSGTEARLLLQAGIGVENGGVGLLQGVAYGTLAADGPAYGGEGLPEIRVPADELPGGARQALHRLGKQQLRRYQQDENHAADDQPDRRLVLRAAPAAASGPAQLLGAAALGIG